MVRGPGRASAGGPSARLDLRSSQSHDRLIGEEKLISGQGPPQPRLEVHVLERRALMAAVV